MNESRHERLETTPQTEGAADRTGPASGGSEAAGPASRLNNVLWAAWTALVVAGILFGLAVGVGRLTASPLLCQSCHEIRPKVESWQVSAHAQVGCPACHEQPRPWYAFPQTLVTRWALLERDVVAHFSSADPSSLLGAPMHIDDSRCLACHDPVREVTMRYGTLIDHQEHAERNDSCISCHLFTGHPLPDAERPLLLMERCFTCHGREEGAEAPGDCRTCHPPSFEKRPASHQPWDWREDHGGLALAGRQQCVMCHEQSFCEGCHQLPMPHPPGWSEGEVSHGPAAEENRRVCASCHDSRSDFCVSCHHREFDAALGRWIDQHPDAVESAGASSCMQCHEPTSCAYCHRGGADRSGV